MSVRTAGRRLATGLLVLAVASSGTLASPASAVRAADASNIPGIPLEQRTVTGSLGGAVVDVVYNIDLPAGIVLAIYLTGPASTDFDLYLFDSSATSVYGTTGLVAKSVTNTSSETIYYPVKTAGRYYIDLSGFGEAQGDYRLAVAFASDPNPPKATLFLDGGAAATNDSNVSALVVATDDLSGVTEMQFRVEGAEWEPWAAYQLTTTRRLLELDGPRTVSVRVRDAAGNVSGIATAVIVLDRVAPRIVARSPGPAEAISKARPPIVVRFSEPIDTGSWLRSGLTLTGPSGTIEGSLRWDAKTFTGTFTPYTDLATQTTYSVVLGDITDAAGNRLPPGESWTITRLLAPDVSLAADRTVAPWGSDVTFQGRTSGTPAGTYELQRSVDGGSWAALGQLTPLANGEYSATVRVTAAATYRVAYLGAAAYAATTSDAVTVRISRAVRLTGGSTGTPVPIRRGVARSLALTLTPSAPNVRVTATVSRLVAGRWRVSATPSARSAGGRARISWRPKLVGTYRVVFATPASPGFVAGRSATYLFRVR